LFWRTACGPQKPAKERDSQPAARIPHAKIDRFMRLQKEHSRPA
jgi:hypothetical protein